MKKVPFLLRGRGYSRILSGQSLDFQARMVEIFGDRLIGSACRMPQVLVFTRTDDPEADAVGLRLTSLDVPYLRIDADALEMVTLSLTEGSGPVEVHVGSRGRHSRDPCVVWYRHFDVSAIDTPANDIVAQSYVRAEWELSVRGLMSASEVRWINRPDAAHDLDRVSQLRLARSVGLVVPETLVSNDPDRIRAFVGSCPGKAVVKVLGSHFVETSPRTLHGIFPQMVDASDMDILLEASIIPSIFQEYIPHVSEIRVTIIGDEIIAAEVSQTELGDVFERPDNVFADEHTLPIELEMKLKRYMRLSRLEYGAFDLLLTPDGRYFFLEVNFTGDWTWLEARNDSFNITEKACSHIVRLLSQNTEETGCY